MPAPSYDVIIPCRNEGSTIASVVRAARGARGVGRVIVVDDHSSDDTATRAREAGAEVVTSLGQASKALALASGIAVSKSDVVLFFDGDILDAAPEHVESLAAPVLSGSFAMCCGLVDYGTVRNRIFLRLPPITGLRCLRREIFEAIPKAKLNGFQIEIMINEVIARNRLPTAIRVLARTGHRSKIEKAGMYRGIRQHLSMTLELLHCFTFVPLWTYCSYLQNLTVLEINGPRPSSVR